VWLYFFEVLKEMEVSKVLKEMEVALVGDGNE
jgi:hypothetical protein